MKYSLTVTLLLFLLVSYAVAQKRSLKTGTLTGKADIGPLCPREPCTVTAEKLKAVFDAHRVVICDINKNPLQKITINADSSFSCKLKPGNYMITINPLERTALNTVWKNCTIYKGKTTRILVEYDTGMR
jgi:hypothetical protein